MGVGRRWWFVKGLVRNRVIIRIVEEEVNKLFCLVLVGVEQRDAEAETHGNRGRSGPPLFVQRKHFLSWLPPCRRQRCYQRRQPYPPAHKSSLTRRHSTASYLNSSPPLRSLFKHSNSGRVSPASSAPLYTSSHPLRPSSSSSSPSLLRRHIMLPRTSLKHSTRSMSFLVWRLSRVVC